MLHSPGTILLQDKGLASDLVYNRQKLLSTLTYFEFAITKVVTAVDKLELPTDVTDVYHVQRKAFCCYIFLCNGRCINYIILVYLM